MHGAAIRFTETFAGRPQPRRGAPRGPIACILAASGMDDSGQAPAARRVT